MDEKFKTNTMYYYALQYLESDKFVNDKDIASVDMTEVFFKEIPCMIKERESINININGPVRKGKSTVSFAIGKFIVNLMYEMGMSEKKYSLWNIVRSQYELGLRMRDSKLNNTLINVDEYDDLEDTGENATVNKALLKHFSKIQAGRYIHRIYNSPSDVPDTESDIILNVVQPDKVNRSTYCRLYYKVLKGGNVHIKLIGHIKVYVGDIIKAWVEENIEERFYSSLRKPDSHPDRKFVEMWRKKDWYVDYQCRKFEKMDMLNDEGIFRTKDLDYSDVILYLVNNLHDLTLIGNVSKDEIINQVRYASRKFKVIQSIIGDKLMTDRVSGVLSLYTKYYQYVAKIKKLNKAFETGTLSNSQEFKQEKMILKSGVAKLKTIIDDNMVELEKLAEIKKKYYEGI